MTFEPIQIVLGLALALAVGGLVGLERERHAHAQGKDSIGGARTFPLVCLFGALVALLAQPLGPLVFVAGFAAVTVLLALGYQRTRGTGEKPEHGLTTELSALLVFVIGALPFVALGGLAFPQRLLLAGALGTVIMALLALREPIHEFVRALSREDLLATVRFTVIAVVVLPLLPDQGLGPHAALNPFRVGVVIVLIAGISFVGYIAARALGTRRGIGVTAVAGGLVSSTAVTLTFAARARDHRALVPACALAIVLAATIMVVRVWVEILVIDASLAPAAALPLAAMLLVSLTGCAVLWRRAARRQDHGEPELHNPFRLRQALRLGLVYAVIRLLAAAAWDRFGSGGLFASAALSGLADVDAITISVARMHQDGLATGIAVGAVTIATVTNTVVKVGLAVALGGWRLAIAVALVLLPTAAIGAAAVFVAR